MVPSSIDTPLSLRIVMVHGEWVVGAVVGETARGVDLRALVSIAAEPLSTKADAIAVL